MNKFEEYVLVAKELLLNGSKEEYLHAKLKALRISEEEIFLIIKAADILKEDELQHAKSLHAGKRKG